MHGGFAEDKLSSDHQMGLSLRYQGQRLFYSKLSYQIDLLANLSRGYEQGTDFTAKTGLWIKSALLSQNWSPSLALSLGVINQSLLRNPQFLNKQSFPGIMLHFQRNGWSLVAQQSLVTGQNLSSRYQEKEKLPWLSSMTTEWELSRSHWNLQFHSSLFTYHNLTSDMARQSVTLGNSAHSPGVNRSEFDYDFRGINLSSRLNIPVFPKTRIEFTSRWIQNMAAPKGRNQAAALGLSLEKALWNHSRLSLMGEWFSTQSDASPAHLNSAFLGHNNREGHLIKFTWLAPSGKLKSAVSYVQKNPISDNHYQSLAEEWRFYLEGDYEMLFN